MYVGCPAMSYAGGRRLILSLVVLLIISVLQIWVCSDCKVGAIRIFPGYYNWAKETTEKSDMSVMKKMGKSENEDEFLNKFFNGRAFDFKRNQQGFEESKRRIPSCPDPLHN
uniref:CLAVATA3/ESR (CLE)-related protein 27 n=1 Tax=Nelumbo nucifera TaxID=4432 RepID=A0A822YUV3_NELNU|nr:TPA_asm: hypothetical protein HUJ06_005991 [Nelumbo nucifera]